MKSALALAFLSTLIAASHGIVHQHRSGGWVQNPNGKASFTAYYGCGTPSCGVSMTSGYTAAVNVLSFGAMESHGDACGRCFQITPTSDPYSPDYEGSMGNTIVVRVTDLCPFSSAGTEGWCDQTLSEPLNAYKMPMQCVFVFLPLGPWDSENKTNRSFDLCADSDSGAAAAFFPEGRGAMLGEYKEVSCTEWKGGEGSSLWGGSCMAPIGTSLWPKVSCGNEGSPPRVKPA